MTWINDAAYVVPLLFGMLGLCILGFYLTAKAKSLRRTDRSRSVKFLWLSMLNVTALCGLFTFVIWPLGLAFTAAGVGMLYYFNRDFPFPWFR